MKPSQQLTHGTRWHNEVGIYDVKGADTLQTQAAQRRHRQVSDHRREISNRQLAAEQDRRTNDSHTLIVFMPSQTHRPRRQHCHFVATREFSRQCGHHDPAATAQRRILIVTEENLQPMFAMPCIQQAPNTDLHLMTLNTPQQVARQRMYFILRLEPKECEMQTDSRMSTMQVVTDRPADRKLSARLEPFDSYWQAPADVESGYKSFTAYYKANYLPHVPENKNASVLVISCGPGYLVHVLRDAGYTTVLGIDSDPAKIEQARRKGLACETSGAFGFLDGRRAEFDVIIPEQELNHLTIQETIDFLGLCRLALRPGGKVIVYAMNGANPLVGSENIAHNIDHFYNVTEYSLQQLLQIAGFSEIRPFALKLYVFWKNPLNYVGLCLTTVLELLMRVIFTLYGKKVTILSKKIAAVGVRKN
jgi:2-polyprenyl-3-methyl-5-hydroxy-6-metoxy-1,4-benzoquinol methylase